VKVIAVVVVVLLLCALALASPTVDGYIAKMDDMIDRINVAERVIDLQMRVIRLEAKVDSLHNE